MRANEQIKKFILSELMHDDPGVEIGDDDSLLELGVLDSLGLLKVLSHLEQEYQLTIQDQDIVPENFETISAIVALIDRHRPGTASH